MKANASVLTLVGILIAPLAHADLIIDVGAHSVLANTPAQAIDVLVTSTSPGSDSLVSGMNLHAEIGDGTGAGVEPVFNGTPSAAPPSMEGFDFSTSIFAGNLPSGAGPVFGAPSVIDAGIVTSANVAADGILVTLIVDTTGFSTPGAVFAVNLADHATPFPTDTELLGPIGNANPISITITNGSIELMTPFEPTGDFDSDGDVDGDDFLAWQTGFGISSGAELADGDANGDGAVDGNDFLIWQGSFGSASGTSAVAAVPEPAGLAMALLAITLFALRGISMPEDSNRHSPVFSN